MKLIKNLSIFLVSVALHKVNDYWSGHDFETHH